MINSLLVLVFGWDLNKLQKYRTSPKCIFYVFFVEPVILSNFLKFISMWSHSMTTQLLVFGAAIATKMSSLKEKMSADMAWMGMDWWRTKSGGCRQKQQMSACWQGEIVNMCRTSLLKSHAVSCFWETKQVGGIRNVANVDLLFLTLWI